MASLHDWLAAIGCGQYVSVLAASGYGNVSSLSYLDDATLRTLGVYDANHRQAILQKASGGVDDDFDNMLGDLSSVIADLESFSVPIKVDSSALSTNTATPDSARKVTRKPPVPPPRKTEPDFDLDSLLTDLSSFNPSDVVAETHPNASLPNTPSHVRVTQSSPPPAHVTPPSQPSPAHPPSHQWHTAQSVPVQNHHAPTPPTTPGRTPSMPEHAQDSPGHAHVPFGQAHASPGHAHISPGHAHASPSHVHTSPGHGSYMPGTPDGAMSSPKRSLTMDPLDSHSQPPHDGVILRTHSASMPSGQERGSVTMVPQPDLSGATERMTQEEINDRLERKALELMNDPNLSEAEREARMKEEKMRIGIEKMRIAHKKRVAIEVYNPDRSKKTVVVEEGMTSSMVCHLLVVKNHFDESPNWVLVEQLGDVSLERELEDHENIVFVYSTWPRENNNVFLFKQNEKKYDLFEDPMKYFPGHLHSSHAATGKASTLERAEKARKILLQEYFSSTSRVPELEGWLHFKDGYKTRWKKIYVILRASGLYYSSKGKSKAAKHLVQMIQFEDCELYHGINFKKTLKSPSPFCFALRPLSSQFVPGAKDIKVLCADDEPTALSWTAGIRLSKYGLQLRDNFHRAKMTQFKLEDLTAPEGSRKAEDRASKLIGNRLERHMEKIREQYKAQRTEEEERRRVYRESPSMPQRGGTDGSSSNSQTPDDTPEASPRHVRQAPAQSGDMQELQFRSPQQQPFNPYPAPSQPAPPPRVSPSSSAQEVSQLTQPPPVAPRPPRQQQPASSMPLQGSPARPRTTPSPDKESMFVFAWYHGAIPRDEAIRRLQSSGGFDGCYLVRDSTTVANSYVLTMCAKGTSKNFQILPVEHPNGMPMYRIDDGPSFSQLDQLLRHYKQDSDRLPCRLTEFCPRPPTRIAEC